MFSGKTAKAGDSLYSTATTGTIGLNTIPTARMDSPGTIRAGVSHSDPHNHAFLGLQIGRPLYINLRQSMQVSSVGEKPSRVYPGIDMRLKLREEGRTMPAIMFGMDSITGHKRHSSEFFALTKQFGDVDLTLGIAWGRLGSAGHFPNPFARTLKHFKKDRDYSDEDSAGPSDWFTGDQIGFFGGVEYFTAIRGLSLKADIGADHYPGERAYDDFDAPPPWSVGFNYTPLSQISIAASVIGADKIMARISFQDNALKWNAKSYKNTKPFGFTASRTASPDALSAHDQAREEGIHLSDIKIQGHAMLASLTLDHVRPATLQIGRAARYLTAFAGPDVETITIVPVRGYVRGRAVSLNRRDLEQAIIHKRGSPEELWHSAQLHEKDIAMRGGASPRRFGIYPEISFSLGEEDTSHLHRISLIFEESKHMPWGFYGGNGLRLNLEDRLYQLDKIRPSRHNPVRSDISRYARNVISVDRSFLSWMGTIKPDLHFAATAGYLEEMFAGAGAEILYRPFETPFAIGAEFWHLKKRDPRSFLVLGLEETSRASGHLNLFYEIPATDMTAFISAGRFLGEDYGGHAGVHARLGNGLQLKGHVSVSNRHDKDAFGKDTAFYGGVELSIPLGNLKFIPESSAARLRFVPMGRDRGQMLDKPVPLYDFTEPVSYRHLGRNWMEILR